MFLRMFQHLLPRARAWSITIDTQLRQFFDGLTGLPSDVRTFADEVWSDIDPQLTRELDAWEAQFNLLGTVLTTQERRDRLDAAWKALGGQSPRYIQDTIQGAGFNVFIHEFWDSASFPPPLTVRDPNTVISDPGTIDFLLSCDATTAICGHAEAVCGASQSPRGILLVNKPDDTARVIPVDPNEWRYILYFGGVTFGDFAQVPLSRKDEFEALCLKLSPAQQWLGLIVEYT